MKKLSYYFFFILLFILLEISCSRVIVLNRDTSVPICDASNGKPKSNINQYVKIFTSTNLIFSVLKDKYTNYNFEVTIDYENNSTGASTVNIPSSVGYTEIPKSSLKLTNPKFTLKKKDGTQLISFIISNPTKLREIRIYFDDSSQDGNVFVKGQYYNARSNNPVTIGIGNTPPVNINTSIGYYEKKDISKGVNILLTFPNQSAISIEKISDDVELDVVLDTDGGVLPD